MRRQMATAESTSTTSLLWGVGSKTQKRIALMPVSNPECCCLAASNRNHEPRHRAGPFLFESRSGPEGSHDCDFQELRCPCQSASASGKQGRAKPAVSFWAQVNFSEAMQCSNGSPPRVHAMRIFILLPNGNARPPYAWL